MDFFKATLAMEAGDKITNPNMKKESYLYLDGRRIYIGFDDKSSQSYGIQYSDLRRNDWVLYEDPIPEVKIESISKEYFICPSCSNMNEYKTSMNDKKTVECVFCKKKVKLIKSIDINIIGSPKINTSKYTNPISAWFLGDFPSYSNIKTKEEAERIVNRLVSEYTNTNNYRISLPSLNIDKTLKPGEIIIKNPDKYTTIFEF